MAATRVCQICGKKAHLIPAAVLRPAIANTVREAHPDFSPDGFVCLDDLNAFRNRYIESLLQAEKGELSNLEKEVIESLRDHELLAANVEERFDAARTLGERLSDRMAGFGGSWRFIGIFGGVLVVWIALNTWVLLSRPFDPYPFILLNLVLSCLAAIQAPIIMMSQNRQEAKDRLRSEHDYQVNLKAELEIRQLHQKIDHLLTHQWERLVEIQQVQLELMNDLKRRPS
jgi:uncharacterized membrane protein